ARRRVRLPAGGRPHRPRVGPGRRHRRGPHDRPRTGRGVRRLVRGARGPLPRRRRGRRATRGPARSRRRAGPAPRGVRPRSVLDPELTRPRTGSPPRRRDRRATHAGAATVAAVEHDRTPPARLGPRLVVAGTHSGVGKTTVATGLLA